MMGFPENYLMGVGRQGVVTGQPGRTSGDNTTSRSVWGLSMVAATPMDHIVPKNS